MQSLLNYINDYAVFSIGNGNNFVQHLWRLMASSELLLCSHVMTGSISQCKNTKNSVFAFCHLFENLVYLD